MRLEAYVVAMKRVALGTASFNVPVDGCKESRYSGVIYDGVAAENVEIHDEHVQLNIFEESQDT